MVDAYPWFSAYIELQAAYAASTALCVTDMGWRLAQAAAQACTHGLWSAARHSSSPSF